MGEIDHQIDALLKSVDELRMEYKQHHLENDSKLSNILDRIEEQQERLQTLFNIAFDQ